MRHSSSRLAALVAGFSGLALLASCRAEPAMTPLQPPRTQATAGSQAADPVLNPLSIDAMRQRDYPGSDVQIEQTLPPGGNYRRYIASYRSDGLKIFALLTVPTGARPVGGWPVIVFNHGYIPPAQYRTTERYVAYVDALARAGYIVFKPDYRGHGSSEGQPSSAYGSPGYTDDVLNAVTTMQRYPNADPNRIGMWGHSMGGNLTLRALVIDPRIKVAVIWAGVTASYLDLLENWHPPPGSGPPPSARGTWRKDWTTAYGPPEQNPGFWNSISPMAYLADITAPIEIHHGTADEEVPLAFSQKLNQQLHEQGKNSQLFTYAGDDHNISHSFGTAMSRTVAFFNRALKS